jgi:hypothetical protein
MQPEIPSGQAKLIDKTSPIFIHSELDDAGLLPSEFRVLCHIARRGECYASLETIAEICRLSEDTTRTVLKSLVAQSFILAERRDGETTLRRVAPRSSWNPSRKSPPLGKKGSGVKPNPTPPKKQEDHPSENKGAKGTPLEVNPIKGIFPVQKLSTAELISLEKELDRIAKRRDQIKKSASHDAWGAKFSDSEKAELREAKQREAEIKNLLGAKF